MVKNTVFVVEAINYSPQSDQQLGANAKLEGMHLHCFARCRGCRGSSLFEVVPLGFRGTRNEMTSLVVSKQEYVLNENDGDAVVLSQLPEPQAPSIPEHLPENVVKALLDAELNFHEGRWNPAAIFYGKAIERGVVPFINGDPPRMLGPKIAALEKTGLLPAAMLDWVRLVKDDRNFAAHENDLDFEVREDVEPTREFAMALLTYLYTMPKRVELARAKAAEL
jgi:hypothetical protein